MGRHIITEFAKKGKFDVVEFLLEEYSIKEQKSLLCVDQFIILKSAAKHQKVDLLLDYLEFIKPGDKNLALKHHKHEILMTLASNGMGKSAIGLLEKVDNPVHVLRQYNSKFIKLLAQNNEIEAVKEALLMLGSGANKVLARNDYELIKIFAQNNNFDATITLLSTLTTMQKYNALSSNDKIIAKFIIEHSLAQIPFFDEFTSEETENILCGQNFDLLRFLASHNLTSQFNNLYMLLSEEKKIELLLSGGSKNKDFAVIRNFVANDNLEEVEFLLSQIEELIGTDTVQSALKVKNFVLIRNFLYQKDFDAAHDLYEKLDSKALIDFSEAMERFPILAMVLPSIEDITDEFAEPEVEILGV